MEAMFDRLKKAWPRYAYGMEPLAFGASGLALGNDEIVRKIIFRPANRVDEERALVLMEHEVHILRTFQTHAPRVVEVPVLIGEPEPMTDVEFMSMYEMTRLKGMPYNAIPEQDATPEANKALYKSAGILTARFHAGISHLDFGTSKGRGGWHGNEIIRVDSLGDEINDELMVADRLLKATMVDGNVHGDINGGNVITRGSEANGLIDFTYTGRSKNIFTDMFTLDKAYQAAFVEGYGQEYGQDIQSSVDAASLCVWASMLLHNHSTEADIQNANRNIPEIIERLQPALEPFR